MAARRLLVLMLVVLVVSTVGAALFAPRPTPTQQETETTTTTHEPSDGSDASSGRLIERTVQSASRRPRTVRMRVGDQLELIVRTRASVQVEIPRLGMIEHAGPDAPAHFSVLPSEPGQLAVRVADGRTIAVIRVAEPGESGEADGRPLGRRGER